MLHLPITVPVVVSATSPEGELKRWLGPDLDPGPFKNFALARRQDLTAGAKEPYRTWLFDIMLHQSNHLRYWAATRLVEAGAEPIKGIAYPNGFFLNACAERFSQLTIRGNGERQYEEIALDNPPVEWKYLGDIAVIPSEAPCWSEWRSKLKNGNAPSITLGFYGLFSPRLEAGDEEWVRKALAAACENPVKEPWRSMAFLLATDWLMLYGQEHHWKAFKETCKPSTWQKALAALEKQVRKMPMYWNSSTPDAQGVRPPLTHYPEHGVGCFVPPKLRWTTILEPEYPTKASSLHYTADIHVDVNLDPQGHVMGLSLHPGYLLGVFGPEALEWVDRWTFAGATLDGTPIPFYFAATVRFVRTPS